MENLCLSKFFIGYARLQIFSKIQVNIYSILFYLHNPNICWLFFDLYNAAAEGKKLNKIYVLNVNFSGFCSSLSYFETSQ